MWKKISLVFCLICSVFTVASTNVIAANSEQKEATALKLGVAASDMYDATDKAIFGDNALSENHSEDQSDKLSVIVIQAKDAGKWLFIPAGTYIINKVVYIKSNVKITGSVTGASVLKNETADIVLLETQRTQYPKATTIYIKNLFLDGIGMYGHLITDVQLENNVFYNPRAKFIVELKTVIDSSINNNIFLRSLAYVGPDRDWGRTVYIGGHATSLSYQWSEDIEINNNIFGAKINELDAIKAFSKPETVDTIERLQRAIAAGVVALVNEQNFIVTGVNSFNNLRRTYIENNLFYSGYEDTGLEVIMQDHAIYLRGSQDIYFANNHVRGWHNGPAGAVKFKSGKNITIVNNYLRNTGVIMYSTAEYGLGESFEEGKISLLSNWLVANNLFDWKKWDGAYSYGIEYQSVGIIDPAVENMVFTGNEYINYHNIPQLRRRGILKIGDLGFNPEKTFVADNTRDDTPDKFLGVEYWDEASYGLMPPAWEPLITQRHKDYYAQKITEPMPVQETLATAVPTTVELGNVVAASQLVKDVSSSDEPTPTITLKNPEIFTTAGKHIALVEIVYSGRNNNTAIIQVPVSVIGKEALKITVVKTDFERGVDIATTDVVSVSNVMTKGTLETTLAGDISVQISPEIDSLKVGTQLVEVTAVDASGNTAFEEIAIAIYKSQLQLDIENLFEGNQLKASVTITEIEVLRSEVNKLNNEVLKAEFTLLLDQATAMLGITEDKRPTLPTTGESEVPVMIMMLSFLGGSGLLLSRKRQKQK
ncbi:MAG: LPXTG cell wall anchor domain-containing protein [Culicoidibacterales bacterium]